MKRERIDWRRIRDEKDKDSGEGKSDKQMIKRERGRKKTSGEVS